MCHPESCRRDCAKDLHAATTPEARAKAACVCDPAAGQLQALIADGWTQKAASEFLWGDQPCETCVFVLTPGGKCMCREVS